MENCLVFTELQLEFFILLIFYWSEKIKFQFQSIYNLMMYANAKYGGRFSKGVPEPVLPEFPV
jgi:hypothetical protein